jgi:metallo-beta-lactamase family protein
MADIKFYGAAGEVTGSNHLVTTDKYQYVVDCGLFQGADSFTEHNEKPFAFDPKAVDAVIITHAHLDHIGRLPKLVKEGFRGPIYATRPTIELMALTLKDAVHLMTMRQERNFNHPVPLYDEVDLAHTMAMCKPVPYHTPHPLLDNDTITMFDAGHILGSASVLLEAGGEKIVFSGDIGHWPSTLLPKPETPKNADTIVMEGTYGGVEREDRGNRLEIIKTALAWTIEHKGVLLIPAFAVERSQELLYLLHHLFHTNQLPKMPIYFDSPLAIEALKVFEQHYDLFKQEVQRDHKPGDDIFDFRNLVITPTGEDSRDINNQAPPKVIIAGSGMMEGGRIHFHLKRYLSHANTLLLIIGYQAKGTLGDRILSGAENVEIMGAHIPVRAKVENVSMFSGHADNSELLEWAGGIELSAAGRVFIVHSEPERAQALAKEIQQQKPQAKVEVAAVEG